MFLIGALLRRRSERLCHCATQDTEKARRLKSTPKLWKGILLAKAGTLETKGGSARSEWDQSRHFCSWPKPHHKPGKKYK